MEVGGEEAEASRGGVSGDGGTGDLIPSSTPARGVRRGRAPVPTLVGGTGKGRERPRERDGPAGWARWASVAMSWAVWSRGGLFLLFYFHFFNFFFVWFFHLSFLLFFFCVKRSLGLSVFLVFFVVVLLFLLWVFVLLCFSFLFFRFVALMGLF